MFPAVTLVLGGAASGKSAYAESLFVGLPETPVYLASGQAFDSEMRAKIARHVAQRGTNWDTIEAPLNAAGVLRRLGDRQHCLFDCATFWLTNHMLAESDLGQEQALLLQAINTCAGRMVIVTNEVGQGIVPEQALSRRFREAQGRLNIALAQHADCVVQVIAGLPQPLKGTLP